MPLATVASNGYSSQRLEALTGARFFAAASVLLMHFAVVGALGVRDASLHGQWLSFWVATGGAGVGFFFVLSGFVLAHTYARTFASTGCPRDTAIPRRSLRRRFWLARAARIYPTYLAALLLTTGSALWLGHLGSSPWAECRLDSCGIPWLLSAVPVQAWFPDFNIQQLWNAPGWSIATEAFFYLLFPFLVTPVLACVRRWGWGVVAALWLVQNTAFAVLSTLTASASEPATQAGLNLWLERLPLLRLPEFLLGVAAWGLWRQTSSTAPGIPDKTPALSSAGAFWVLVLVLGALWFLPVPATPNWLHLLASAKAYSMAAPLFALLVLHLARASAGCRPAHLPARVLSSRPLVLLGEASYALYILHWAVLQSLFALYRSVGDAPPIWAGYAALIFALVVSLLVNQFFELPLRRRFAAYSSARR